MTAAQFWEERYAGRQVWSGKVNATMAALVAELPAGKALELGCGEGGDAVWLAEQGWQVTAVDISPTAIERGRAAAAERGLAERIEWIAADLSDWAPAGSFDLVTASFLQSPLELERAAILRRAAQAVAPGGRLLLVSHAAAPPWASGLQHGHAEFPQPPPNWPCSSCLRPAGTSSPPRCGSVPRSDRTAPLPNSTTPWSWSSAAERI